MKFVVEFIDRPLRSRPCRRGTGFPVQYDTGEFR